MQWELVLEFCLPAGSPLLELYRVEQSWPTRDSGAAVASFRCVGSSSSNPSPCWLLQGTGSRDYILAFVTEDLEGFVEDRSQLGKDWATANATTFVVLDLRLRDAHPIHFPIDVLPTQR